MNWDEIEKYLKDRAQRIEVDSDWIHWFKLQHKGRDIPIYNFRTRIYRTVHRHGSNPYCGICEKELKPGEEVYLFYVGGGRRVNLAPYHISCVDNQINFRVKAIVQQDRAFRAGAHTSFFYM